MPSAAPQKDLAKALLGIGIQEWPEIFHTLTTVRRLSLHHSALVIASRYLFPTGKRMYYCLNPLILLLCSIDAVQFLNIVIESMYSSSINNGATSGAAGGGGNSGAGRGMHCIVVGVLKQVDNLRSAVAKNALLTLGDLFQGLGKFMDLEVALCLTHVLKVRCEKEACQIIAYPFLQ